MIVTNKDPRQEARGKRKSQDEINGRIKYIKYIKYIKCKPIRTCFMCVVSSPNLRRRDLDTLPDFDLIETRTTSQEIGAMVVPFKHQ